MKCRPLREGVEVIGFRAPIAHVVEPGLDARPALPRCSRGRPRHGGRRRGGLYCYCCCGLVWFIRSLGLYLFVFVVFRRRRRGLDLCITCRYPWTHKAVMSQGVSSSLRQVAPHSELYHGIVYFINIPYLSFFYHKLFNVLCYTI